MSTYNTRLYLNTGFNAVNIPDGPALLEQCAHFDAMAVNVMQNRFLNKIRVRATWENVKDADYVCLYSNNADFYFIESIVMLANDVAELTVLFDYVTSAGGVANINILDGVTARVHVTDDSFGKYTEEDPLTMPASPLEIQTTWFNPSTDAHTYVEATINLAETGVSFQGKRFATGDDENSESVVVPTVKKLNKFTSFYLDNVPEHVNPHTLLYDLDDTTKVTGARYNNQEAVLLGITRARELGIEEGAVINQVQIPTVYADVNNVEHDAYSTTEGVIQYTTTDTTITRFKGKSNFAQSNIPYEYTGARNNRLNYGEYTKYGIISCSGESCEYKAENIKDPQNPTSPLLKYVGDPHTDGKPYFRWKYVDGNDSDIGFFRNCISGLQWKQVPLYFAKASGTALNTLKYQNTQHIADLGYQQRTDQRNLRAKTSIIEGTLQQGASGGIMGAIGGAIGSGINALNLVRDQIDDYEMYQAQKRSEMSDYLVKNTVSAPTINFPFNSEIMRDFYGNGCLMYRYKYTSADINRIDKLLTMYGYRYTKALEKSDFTSKINFNYVECANVSVTGFAKWMNDGIAMMLKNGVRVWHVLPNPAYYTQNNGNRS